MCARGTVRAALAPRAAVLAVRRVAPPPPQRHQRQRRRHVAPRSARNNRTVTHSSPVLAPNAVSRVGRHFYQLQ